MWVFGHGASKVMNTNNATIISTLDSSCDEQPWNLEITFNYMQPFKLIFYVNWCLALNGCRSGKETDLRRYLCFQTQFIHNIPQNHNGGAAAASEGIVGFNFCSCAVVVLPPGCGSPGAILNTEQSQTHCCLYLQKLVIRTYIFNNRHSRDTTTP